MSEKEDLEEELSQNLIEGATKLLFDNFFEYGIKKIIQKAPEWNEKFQNWKKKYFY